MTKRPAQVLLVAETPPPFHGRNVANQYIVDTWPKESIIRLIHLNTTDDRPIRTLGQFDLTNAFLALKYWVLLIWYLVKERPDTVHIPVGQNTWAFVKDSGFLLIARLFRVKRVIHLHGGHFRRFYDAAWSPFKWWIRFSLSGVSRAMVLGSVFKPIFAGLVPADRVVIIPYGIDGSAFTGRDEATPASHPFTVLFFSNWIKEKGFLDVIQAIPLVIKEMPDTRFVFAGAPGPEADKQEAIALVERYALNDVIEFRGLTVGEDKVALFSQANLFVLPTYYPYEGQPLVLLEAMAAGLPIITTDQGTIAETVIHEETGLIIPKQDPQAIANAIQRLAKDSRLYEAFAKAARKRFEDEYSVERYASRIVSLHAELIGQG